MLQKTSWHLRALATDLLAPEAGVELGEDGLDLPSGGGGVQVGGLEDVDTFDRGLGTQVCRPSESNGLTGDGIDVQDGESDGWLGALSSDESLLGGEGGRAQRNTGEEVDRVGCVGEV